MGKKLNLYYEQLKNLMSAPPKTLDEAMVALKAKRQAAVPEEPRSEEERKRLDYSLKCGDQIMNRAAEKIKKEAAWDEAIRKISRVNKKPDLTIPKGTGDWMVSMMKTGNTWQDLVYNVTLAAQIGLCTGKLTVQETLKAYEEQRLQFGFRADDIPGFLYKAPQKILEELNKKIEQGQQQLEELDGSTDAILGGEASDEALNKAFEVVESDEIDLLLNAEGALDNIRGFEKTLPEKYPGKLPSAELDEWEKKWQAPDKKRIDSTREKAEQAGDQFYADLNQEAPAEENEERYSIDADLPFAREDEEENIKEGDKPPIVQDMNVQPLRVYTEEELKNLKNQALNDSLAPYRLNAQDNLRENNSGYTVYGSMGNTIILRVEEVKADDGSISFEIHDNAPGRYANYDLEERTRSAISKCHLLEEDEENREHTREFLDLREKLNALGDLKLSDQPNWAEATEASLRFEQFQKSLETFIDKQFDRHHRVNGLDGEVAYEATIRELKDFSSEKLHAIDAVIRHVATKNRLELSQQELGASISKAQADVLTEARYLSSPDDYLNFAIKWTGNIGKVKINYALRENAAANHERFSELRSIFDDFATINQQDGKKMEEILGKDRFAAGTKSKLLPEELTDSLAKSALACGVVKELLKMESQMNIKANPPIKELVDNGKLSEVIDMVKNSQSFGENYRALDLSDISEKELKNLLTGKSKGEYVPHPKEIAQDIMKIYLSRQRQAEQNAQQPERAPVDMRIKGPKQPVLK